MPEYVLPSRPEVDSFLGKFNENGDLVLKRAAALLRKKGYVLGPNGVTFGPFGGFVVDSDRDPTADYMAWDPTVKADEETQLETAKQVRLSKWRQARDVVQAGDFNSLTAAQRKEFFLTAFDLIIEDLENDS